MIKDVKLQIFIYLEFPRIRFGQYAVFSCVNALDNTDISVFLHQLQTRLQHALSGRSFLLQVIALLRTQRRHDTSALFFH